MLYNDFPTAILRSPLLPLKTNFSTEDLINLYSQKNVAETLFIASPVLFNEFQKSLKNKEFGNAKKLLFSLLKYSIRMHSRCTPFGLFSGCGVIDIQTGQNYTVSTFHPKVRLDMQYICSLVDHLAINQNVATQKFYLFKVKI